MHFEILAHGKDFNPDPFSDKTSLTISSKWYKNEKMEGRPATSGISIKLGDGNKLFSHEQEKITIEFIKKNKIELLNLSKEEGLSYFILGIQHNIEIDESTVGFAIKMLDKELFQLLTDTGLEVVHYINNQRTISKSVDDNFETTTVQEDSSLLYEEASNPYLVTTGLIMETNNELLSDRNRQQIYTHLLLSGNEISSNFEGIQETGSINFIELDPTEKNCFKCNHCNRWTTHAKRENEIQGLPIGYSFDGKDYCDQCLSWKDDPQYGWTVID